MKTSLKAKVLLVASVFSLGGVALAADVLRAKEEKPGQLARAKISAEQAVSAEQGRVPDAKLEAVEIEEEGGVLVFAVELETKTGEVEVLVDAQTGAVTAVESEQQGEEQEGNEAAEDDD